MVASRESDIIESELVNRGEANFLASSKGHEGSVIFAPFLNESDFLHCHYRDKALMLARGVSYEMLFYSALAKAESSSCGRQMVSHMSDSRFNITSIVAAVGSNALQAAGVAKKIKDKKNKPIVLCLFGDGTTQQGEVLEGIAEANRSNLPVLFVVHNNYFAISTRTTGKTFFSFPDGSNPDSFHGVPITYLDAINIFDSYDKIEETISTMRNNRAPQIIILDLERLDNHSNADDQKLYRSESELILSQDNDPLALSYQYLVNCGINPTTIDEVKNRAINQVRQAVEIARNGTQPNAIHSAEAELSSQLQVTATEYTGDLNSQERYTMLEAMRETFDYHLANDKNVFLFGEDIEDKKGDVFGVTKGLSTKYPQQVQNSPLSESTIVGMSIGMALAGAKPVAFIQFADFLAPAFNQIYTELATMYWRTNGSWQTPVIVFAACGGYRPGLGPFHSQTNEGTYAHIPGLDVFMPSNAADAVAMLNAAFKSNRPSLFLYPKKLLNNTANTDTTSRDVSRHLVPIGKARIVQSGSDISLVAWGNTVALTKEVADTLEQAGISCEIIDLRTIKPYDKQLIIKSSEKTGKLLVTHEDNLTCGLGGDIMASVMEFANTPVKAKRVTRADTYTPCNFKNQLEVLPSYERILTAACELLEIELDWEQQATQDKSLYQVEVIGASPSDESVLIQTIYVKPGDKVTAGKKLVDIEASKAAGEILCPCNGIVEQIMVTTGERATVGNLLLTVRVENQLINQTSNSRAKPILTKKVSTKKVIQQNITPQGVYPVGICTPTFKTGSRLVKNAELLKNFPQYNNQDIVQRTGIEQRYWLDDTENIIDVAKDAAIASLDKYGLKLTDIDGIICATSTPDKYQSPSTSCLILEKLYQTYGEHSIIAYDISAACSGYLYALQNAQDYLKTRPSKRVLIITAEYVSKKVNSKDFDTAFLFGDAASATIVCGADYLDSSKATIDEVYLTAIAENGEILSVPANDNEYVKLQGKRLFTLAVKSMAMATHKCCDAQGLTLAEIDLVIPHQANQRIIEAIERRLNMKNGSMYSNVARYGNTSSCTIPIALAETLDSTNMDDKVLLAAFGAGFTVGSAILTTRINGFPPSRE
jgi:2-oxoisovalerate dehydrogenase E1 component